MKNGSEVQLGALGGFVLPPHFLSEAENLSSGGGGGDHEEEEGGGGERGGGRRGLWRTFTCCC